MNAILSKGQSRIRAMILTILSLLCLTVSASACNSANSPTDDKETRHEYMISDDGARVVHFEYVDELGRSYDYYLHADFFDHLMKDDNYESVYKFCKRFGDLQEEPGFKEYLRKLKPDTTRNTKYNTTSKKSKPTEPALQANRRIFTVRSNC